MAVEGQSPPIRKQSDKSDSVAHVAELTRAALRYHQSHRLDKAEQAYRAILTLQPNHLDSLHLLGALAHQTGRNELAVALMSKVLAVSESVPFVHNNIALALRSLGRKDDAIAHFRRAIVLKPDYFEALWALGQSLHERDELDESAACYRAVLKVQPGHADAYNNLGIVLADQGKIDEAINHYQQALTAKPDFADAYYNLGNALLAKGRIANAITYYRWALAVRPQFAEVHHNFANILLGLDKLEEAIIHYQQALAIKPDYAEAYNNLGNALRKHGRLDEAVARYRQSLVIKPAFGDAFNNLGNTLRELGRLAEARDACEKAVAIAPMNPMFHHSLAISKNYAPGDQQLLAMELIASDSTKLAAQERTYLHFALAKAYQDVGEFQRCFSHLLQGNALKREEIVYDEAEMHDCMARIAKVFSPSLLKDKQIGEPSAVPIFIVGMPRSGTSLVEQILASHPKVFGAGELMNFAKGVTRLCQSTPYPEAISNISEKEFRELGTNYVYEIRKLAPGAERITDKMPANFRFAGLIRLALPNARVIHVRRDPMDTCYSCFSKLFEGNQPYSYDLGELGRYYRAYEVLMEHWRNVLPNGFMLEVTYEELVVDLAREARRIIAHCGLQWNDRCLAFSENPRPVRTASALQVRQPIYRSSIGRWRVHEHLLDPLINALSADKQP
jgi:tetratricopeptide (TPR) repeat protein